MRIEIAIQLHFHFANKLKITLFILSCYNKQGKKSISSVRYLSPIVLSPAKHVQGSMTQRPIMSLVLFFPYIHLVTLSSYQKDANLKKKKHFECYFELHFFILHNEPSTVSDKTLDSKNYVAEPLLVAERKLKNRKKHLLLNRPGGFHNFTIPAPHSLQVCRKGARQSSKSLSA